MHERRIGSRSPSSAFLAIRQGCDGAARLVASTRAKLCVEFGDHGDRGLVSAYEVGVVLTLWGEDGLPLAVVEAKRTSKDATVGQHQAKLYADCLEAMTGQRPLIFYTNGFEHYLWN